MAPKRSIILEDIFQIYSFNTDSEFIILFEGKSHLQLHALQETFPLKKVLSGKSSDFKKEAVDYRILIMYTKPEYGENVKFLSMYYASEDKDVQLLRQMFEKAFKLAHASWTIREVVVETNHPDYSSKTPIQVRVMFPEEPVTQRG